MQLNYNKNNRLKGVQILSLGFLAVIFLGGLILSLPISSASGESTNLIDAIFTSTSAVCVTGLVVLDTGTHWNAFGQTIIMILIEIGGLGFMSFTTLIAIIIGKKITLRDRLLLQDAMNTFSIQGLVKMVKYILIFTISVQGIGAVLFSIQFIPQFGVRKGIFFSIFHSVSAFCNAGFDLFGNFSSLTSYSNNSFVILIAGALLIIGGLGFTVWLEIINIKKLNRLSLHSKIVLLSTGILILIPTILMFVFEFNNPNTMQNMNMWDKGVNSFFAAVTPRTAGFNSIPTDGMTTAGNFLTIILMFIGGSPGSTAGGVKTTTVAVLCIAVICVIKGREDIEIFQKRFSKELVYKSITLLFIAGSIVVTTTMILSYTEVGATFLELLYEVTSAMGTAGLSLGITGDLTVVGKIVIMLLMYLGRVGPLTVFLALIKNEKKSGIRFPEEKILIG